MENNRTQQIEHAESLLRAEARSENPDRCVAVVGRIHGILDEVKGNSAIPSNARHTLTMAMSGLIYSLRIMGTDAE